METLYICYYELPKEFQEQLKMTIKAYYAVMTKSNITDEAMEELFNLNNAGIDIDVYSWMLGKE